MVLVAHVAMTLWLLLPSIRSPSPRAVHDGCVLCVLLLPGVLGASVGLRVARGTLSDPGIIQLSRVLCGPSLLGAAGDGLVAACRRTDQEARPRMRQLDVESQFSGSLALA